jgi:dipeptidyl-peptidase-3
MNSKLFILPLSAVLVLNSCKSNQSDHATITKTNQDTMMSDTTKTFEHISEQFADLRILRYQIPSFNELTLQQKTLLYYLSEAALCGRDMQWDQNYKYNLTIRKTLEAIIGNEHTNGDEEEYAKFLVYAKRVFFSAGIHHHYGSEKFFPECSQSYFKALIMSCDASFMPLKQGETKDAFIARIIPVLYDTKIAPKKVSLDASKDLITNSAINFYEGVTQKEVVDFYDKQIDKSSKTPVMIGLNSKLIKENGVIKEKTWKVGGMYTQAIEKIVYWLEKAIGVAENPAQKLALEKLVTFYKTGSLKDFDEYNIAWVKDTESAIDVVNGFIEVYEDPLGKKGSFESIVSVKDFEASKRIATIGANAQWFEDNSTLLPEHKKKNVKGISAKVINAVMESGSSAPSTPIGVNLPNNEWIREVHGSKSVNLGNIVEAYERAAGGSVVNEFYYNDAIKKNVLDFAGLADKLHTDMHEVIGHASGQIEPGVGQPHETLKNYASALEEGRADLVALYYLLDKKLVELGVMPSLDYGKASYDEYITKGLMIQLSRIKLGKDIEEAHMRNRQMVAKWAYEKGKAQNVIEKKMENGKTFFVINDYEKLRVLFGELLRELQRIKSKGDYKAGKDLIENYGVKVDLALHKEVLERYKKLDMAPYQGFIQPKLVPIMKDGKIVDVKVEYPTNFTNQMLEYSKNYSFLPVEN